MKTFIIEREIPGLGGFSAKKLKEISQASNTVVDALGKPYEWVTSYVTGNKLYCIHRAENEDVVREHAKAGNFPIDSICEISGEIDPSTATGSWE